MIKETHSWFIFLDKLVTFYAMALSSYKLCGKPFQYECDMEELRHGEQIDGTEQILLGFFKHPSILSNIHLGESP